MHQCMYIYIYTWHKYPRIDFNKEKKLQKFVLSVYERNKYCFSIESIDIHMDDSDDYFFK